ncbi:MAG: hypothetical protein ACLGIO_10330 [Acidimicrobiia bacterium]
MAGRWPGEAPDVGPFPGGAAARAGATGWVLADERPERALGAALAWSRQAGVGDLHVLAERASGLLARRAGAFSPAPAVWRVEGSSVGPAPPEPVGAEPEPAPGAEAFVPLLLDAGADPVVEAGVLRGEVLGLEVARVVAGEEGPRLEVGVGQADREAQRLVHGDRPTAEALRRAVAAVREVRRPDAPEHQVNRLAAERWMRAILLRRPDLVGARHLEAVPSPVARTDLRQAAPAPAAGVDRQGRPLLVVCSTGIDVDLVPAAADARLADGRQPRLVLVVPEADDHPLTRWLAARLVPPAEVVALAGDWRRL